MFLFPSEQLFKVREFLFYPKPIFSSKVECFGTRGGVTSRSKCRFYQLWLDVVLRIHLLTSTVHESLRPQSLLTVVVYIRIIVRLYLRGTKEETPISFLTQDREQKKASFLWKGGGKNRRRYTSRLLQWSWLLLTTNWRPTQWVLKYVKI